MDSEEVINMIENDLINFETDELIEILAVLEGMNDSLEKQEKILTESGANNENELY